LERVKKIVFVIPDLKGNGAERFVITLSDEFKRQGHDVHIVCFSKFQELDTKSQIECLTFSMQLFRWIPRRIRGLVICKLLDAFIKIRIGTPDLILSNLLPVDRVLSHSKLPNVHLVVHSTMSQEHGVALKKYKSGQYKSSLDDIYLRKPCVCVSKGAMEDFTTLFPTQKNVCFIYNPIDVDFTLQKSDAPALSIPEYLVHVGKFNTAKRQDKLVKAYAMSGIQTPLVLVGQGPLLAEVKSLVSELNLGEKVIFAGFHSNPYPIISNAKAMVVSSDYEGLGLVILEAIVLNTPVVSTDCKSGPRELLPAQNLVPVGDIEALAAKIRQADDNPADFTVRFNSAFLPEAAAAAYLRLVS